MLNKIYYIPQEITLWRKHNESYDAVSDNKDFNGFIKSSDQYLVSQYSLSQIIANVNIPKDKKSLKQFIKSFVTSYHSIINSSSLCVKNLKRSQDDNIESKAQQKH